MNQAIVKGFAEGYRVSEGYVNNQELAYKEQIIAYKKNILHQKKWKKKYCVAYRKEKERKDKDNLLLKIIVLLNGWLFQSRLTFLKATNMGVVGAAAMNSPWKSPLGDLGERVPSGI